MLIPYNTDAPIYHWPYATLATIILNVLMFAGAATSSGAENDNWMYQHLILVYGEWNPIQWLTSNYMHAGLMHILGNMIVLWGIGIIIEGKVGWWRFLLICNGIGVVSCGIEQTLMLFADAGGSLGASGIIYGLIAMAMVWAPRNELNCVLLFGRITTIDLPVITYAGISIGIEFALATLQVMFHAKDGFAIAMTSQILHLMGAATGFPLAAAMVKWHWVDCENWDLFSVMQGRHQLSRAELSQEALHSEDGQTKLAAHRNRLLADLRGQIAAGNAIAALATHRRGMHQFAANWQITADEHLQIISGLRKAQNWDTAVHEMAEFLKSKAPSDRAPIVRLVLAQTLLEQLSRPGQALKVLSKLDSQTLSPTHRATYTRLHALAQKQSADDPFEVITEDW